LQIDHLLRDDDEELKVGDLEMLRARRLALLGMLRQSTAQDIAKARQLELSFEDET